MKHLLIALLFLGVVALLSCKTQKSASKSVSSNTIKPPFAIPDSSKVENLAGGVKLYMLQEGVGDSPKLSQTVLAHYSGRLTNGKVFDSSYERGSPTEFPLNAVIKGWQVGFQKAKPGSRFVLVIPSEMAYGDRKVASIPPNSTLIFDCELISFY